MRNVPLGVNAVASEASSQVIVDTSSRHCVKRARDTVSTGVVSEIKQGFDKTWAWKLRGGAESTLVVGTLEKLLAQEATRVAQIER